MNPEKSLQLARRFIELPLEKRRVFLETLAKEGIDFSQFPIPAGVEAPDRQALSYAQQRMWVLWQMDPQSGAYNLPGAVRLLGQLDAAALEQAFATVLARHQSLTTVFEPQADDRLEQAHRPLTRVNIERVDLRNLAADQREAQVRAEAETESLRPFDLAHGPLLRVRLLHLDAQEHVLLLTLHHIVSDGWSMNVLIDEFSRAYDAFAAGQAPQLPALPIQYVDYALWQRRWLEAGEMERQLQYWQAQLGEEQPVLELPLDHARPATPSFSGSRQSFPLDAALTEQVRGFARQHNLSLFMVLLASFGMLLQRYTGQCDLRIGSPVANRNRAEVEGLIGLFVNTQVLRLQPQAQQDVLAYLQAVRQTVLGAQAHQDLPFERLVEALKVERSLSHAPLFQVMYNHQPQVADLTTVTLASGLQLAPLQWRSRTTQFDLSLDTYEQGGVLHAAFTYASDLFDAATIERMARHWQALLRGLVEQPQQALWQVPMLDDASLATVLQDWNATARDYPLERPVHQLFEDQARRAPQATALVFGEHALSYAQLDARANQLAHYLRAQGARGDSLVGISVQRSVEMVVGLLGILKAGAAYVPLDPEYPAERLAYMIEDSGIDLLLTQQALLDSLPLPQGVQCVALDRLPLDEQPTSAPRADIDPEQLAYVIYTSGSTGRPKGAGNSHRALANRLHWMQEAYAIGADDTVLQKTPFSFDVSVWEFFWPLMTGARLAVAAPGEHRDPARLIETIRRFQVSTLHFVPSMLQAFIHEPGVEACSSLRRIVCSGEALPVDAQAQVFARLPGAALYNLYGPTEAAIDVTHWTCRDEGRDSVPIGLPIANLRTYVLDAGLEPVAPGVSGELYLGGVGLARGYHRRPSLTAERFVADPFVSGQRLYRTGDRVRQRNDGVIEYLGRFDHQVKIRGLRIELGEIEARLAQHEWVREAVVLALDGKQLVAYLVLNEQPDGWQQGLKDWLLQALPEFMVPTHLMPLERLPLTPNGKLDRKALPQPDAAPRGAYVAAQTPVQQILAQVWSEVLGVEQVGLDDNFFELGGDSIIAIQVVSRARRQGLQFSPRDLFQFQTLRGLAGAAGRATQVQAEQGAVQGPALLTPIQRAFFEQAVPARAHWNQSLLLTPRQALDGTRLQQALVRLVEQHDALRLRFQLRDGHWQAEHGALPAGLLREETAADAQALATLCDATQRSLDLADGPLLRAVLVHMADGSQRVLLVIHHLVVDGVSWRVLLEDLQHAYTQQALPAKTSAWQAWAARLPALAAQQAGELDYWCAQRVEHDLPCDMPQGAALNRHGRTLETRLDAELTRQLLHVAPAAYRTQINDLLLTALARVVARWSAQQAVLVQLEGHGREEVFEDVDLSRTVGWFTTLFPVRLSVSDDVGASIKAVKEQLRAVPGKGLGYGLLRYLGDEAQRQALGQVTPARITFNYLGQFDQQFDAQALWAPATERSGQAQDPEAPLANWLTLESQVYAGELSLRWGYSGQMYHDATIEGLAQAYRDELAQLIAHCLQTPAGQATPSDFPLARIDQAQLDALPVAASAIEALYPLSPMQQGMFFHAQYEPEAGAYINQLRLDIQGLEPARLRQAWSEAMARHEILRASVHWEGLSEAQLLVQRHLDLPLQVLEGVHDLDALAAGERLRGFDLRQAPLFRLQLVAQQGGGWHLIYTSHHILMDGWSNASLLAQVIQTYAGQPVAAASGRFSDYLGWLQRQPVDAGERFWKAALAPLQGPTLLASALRRAQGQGSGERLHVFDGAFAERLGQFARQRKVTLNTLFQAAWGLVLQRHTGQPCVAFGATVSGRSAPLPGIEEQLGLFINTLPVLCSAAPGQSVGEALETLQAFNLDLREFEHVPLYKVQGWAGQQGGVLFDTLMVFENFPVAEALRDGAPAGLQVGALRNHERTHYPLTLGIELGARLSVEFAYDLAHFDAAQVEQLCAAFCQALEQMIEQPSAALGSLRLLDDTTQQAVLAYSQGEAIDLSATPLVHQRIAAQAARSPDALAVSCEGHSLSHGQLNRQANRLAHLLIAQGMGPGKRIGLALRRSPQLIVSLLAVLKSGAAYVPLDPAYPDERLRYMIEDSQLDLLLCDDGLLQGLSLPPEVPRLVTGELVLDVQPEHDPLVQPHAQDLAYVIYTSGSTGRPKGVAISHAALREFCQSGAQYSHLGANDRVLQFATFSFDGFVEQCYPPLALGAALVMRGEALWDVQQLAEHIVQHEVTLADLPAAYWYLLAKECAAQPGRGLGALRQVHVGGEAMSVEGLRLWHAAGLGEVALINTYGPTEATVVSSVHACRLGDASDSHGVPIGRAIAGRALYVLDGAGELLPAGAVGELCIAAPACLAQQYYQRPGLTAERFLPDPFAREPGARLYRSGDLACYNAEGALEYIGRIDHQVKIRGMRIEMGEIEACLQAQPGVRAAALIAQATGQGAQLVAFVVPVASEAVQGDARTAFVAALRDALRQSLPEFMVPAHLVVLEQLPLNNNGKLDRAALPLPEADASSAAYIAPRNALQAALADIWAQVLDVPQIGLADHFFERGGHSLLAMQVVVRIRQQLQREVPVRVLFQAPVLEAFAEACQAQAAEAGPALVSVGHDRPLALSYAQERQWFLWQLEPHSASYHIPAALRLRGVLDRDALARSVQDLVDRHASLRTAFVEEDGEVRQVIAPALTFAIDYQAMEAQADEAAIRREVQREIRRPFDLFQAPLLRVRVLVLGERDHVLVMTQHHIVSDGWSMQLLVEQWQARYLAHCRGEVAALEPLALQYADFAQWQRQWLEAGEGARQLAYWSEQLGDEQPVLELPFDHLRPAEQSQRGARLDLSLAEPLVAALREQASAQGVTLFVYLLASFQALLHRYSGQSDIRVGVPVANRTRAETESMVGFFVNTQVLRAQVDGAAGFDQLLQQVRQAVLGAQAHQDLPFEQLVDALQPQRSLSYSPLFQVMHNHQVTPATATSLQGLTLEPLSWDSGTAQFDLSLDTTEVEARIEVSLTYATDLFDHATIERLADHWQHLLQAVVRDPQCPVARLPLLAADEQQRMLEAWNSAALPPATHASLHGLIQARAAQAPEALALICGERELSYRELDTQANRLAHRLRALGVGPEVRVGVALPRSAELVVALLAVLKAGGAYVPLDLAYPRERLAHMLGDSQAHLLLTQADQAAQLASVISEGQSLLLLDDDPQLALQPTHAPVQHDDAEHLAYVIYTSGSTGLPKGVAITHGNAVALVRWAQGLYSQDDLQGVLASTSICFDLSVWELFVTLAGGGHFILADNALALPELPARERVTLINTVPSAIAALLQAGAIPPSVRTINLAGEPLKQSLVDALYALPGIERVHDLYGPSEDTTYSTCVLRQANGRASIGRPLPGTAAYVLDGHLQPQPVGVAGELYLAGEGLARGYLRRPGLSAERFVADPFTGEGGRMYRTGDLVRYREDASIEYLGRIDHQVKVRGFRIELGEIEARLLAHPEVREVAVVARQGELGTQLVGYVAAAASLDDAEPLKAWLKQTLPDYMVPTHWLFLERLPLTPNGKLDRKALPAPQATAPARQVAPRSVLEKRLVAIWEEVLKVSPIGVTDNFFELGGDSIISIQVVSRARQAGIRFTPKALFQHQTVQGLATVAQEGEGVQLIEQGPLTGEMPLLPIQQAFFDTDIPERHHWNQSVLLKPAQPLHAGYLEQALQALVAHHDALRLSFTESETGWQAHYRPLGEQPTELLWQRTLNAADELEALAESAQRSLSLGDGPLLRAVLADLPDGSQRLLLVIHHLAVDGVSWRILFEDLQLAFEQLSSGKPLALPGKTSSQRDWAEQLRRYATEHSAELGYWQQRLQGAAELPCAAPTAVLDNAHAAMVHTRLDKTTTQRLLQEAPAAYRTQVNDLLLTALARTLCRWSGQGSVLVELEGHGREELAEHLDLTRTVGWFTSVFPVCLTPAEALGDSLKQIKEQLRSVPNKGLGFGALRRFADAATREALQALPVARVTFNYLGQFDGSFQAEDGALFSPSGEASGAEQSAQAPLANWLGINGQVYDGELDLSWTYSTQMFDHATLQALARDFAEQLQALVEHCCQPGQAGVTPSDFPLYPLAQAQLDALPVAARQIEDIVPLSPMQQGMLFHSLYQQDASDYVNQMRVDIDGLDPARFREAWQQALDAHDSLRSVFLWQGDVERPLQLVHKQVEVPFRVLDLRGDQDLPAALDRLAAEEQAQGFDLARAPLLRLVLVRTADERHHLIYTHHHILLDGWSNSQLLGEVLQRYAARREIGHVGRYRDYLAWLQAQDAGLSERFWTEQLSVLEAPTRLAQAFVRREAVAQAPFGDHYQQFDAAFTQRLGELARRHKVTVNTLLQGAWLILLQRYTGQQALCFGATVSGRPAEIVGIERQVGLFINTLPVVAQVRAEQALGEWLAELQQHNLALREHEHTALYDIQRWAGQGGEALFDTLVVFENYPVAEALRQAEVPALGFGAIDSHERTNYPLTLAIALEQTLQVHYSYLREAFDDARIVQVAGHLRQVLEQLLEATPGQAIGALELITGQERAQLVEQWNHVDARFDSPRAVHQLFEAQAQRTPEAVAVLFGEQQMSYAELDQQANRLAHGLIEAGLGAEALVGVALERGPQMLVALLAVLKAGAAYVPLDPEYPEERLAYLMQDSRMVLLLTHSQLLARLPAAQTVATLCIDQLASASLPSSAPQRPVHAEGLAYVIYTSGSTGQPKGVAVAHGPLAMHCLAIGERYAMSARDCELHFMSFAFDGAHERWLTCLLHGGRLLIRDPQLWTAEQACAAMHRHGVTVAAFPPVYLQQLAEHVREHGNPPPVRIYCFGGDAVPEAAFELVKAVLAPEHIINGYGPTETVVTPLIWKADRAERCQAAYAPIGSRIGNRSAYVLDDSAALLPQGVAGELYLGGTGVARGYLHRPSLTAERFVPDPYGVPGARLYRSGDLVRQRADGVVDYLGRVDHQVKIRGFRIELGEIEARLQAQDGVREAVVLARPGVGGPQLVGYVLASAQGLALGEAKLREQLNVRLKETLPGYMVPTYLVFLDALPLTPNGKLDRKALPAPDASLMQRDYRAPQGELESAIADIWAAVLKVDRLGRDDNFFELGGHSLLATQATAAAQAQLQVQVPLELIFQADDLQGYAQALEGLRTTDLEQDLSDMHDFLTELETN
ncbi:non-ribosomal peptide synthetase [Pseudomonas putida]|uniref:Non-ribosomal peptide synthetase n=1 Tax=Pseudomonas putida TaxID=303 RepID=A0AAD0PB07_PSEPU|nr:non-ribosomal peptide synthetase [Pseudomonas putida]AXA24574.1 non-ribosomal peptide synthetase [Pseudomonas putida]